METLDQLIAREATLRATLEATPHVQVQGRLTLLRDVCTKLLDTQKQLVEIQEDRNEKERQRQKYEEFWKHLHTETFKELKGQMAVFEVCQDALTSLTN